MDDSWTVVMGPSSGTLTLRRRAGRLWSLLLLIRSRSGLLLLVSQSAKPCSESKPLFMVPDGDAVACVVLRGNNWYFLVSACAILQTQGFDVDVVVAAVVVVVGLVVSCWSNRKRLCELDLFLIYYVCACVYVFGPATVEVSKAK